TNVGVYGQASGALTNNWAGWFVGNIRNDGYTHLDPTTVWYFTDKTIFEYGTDGVVYDSTPVGLYWSNGDYGDNQFQLRNRSGSHYANFAAGTIYGSYLQSSGSAYVAASLTVINTASIGSGSTQGVLDFNSTTA